MSWLDGVKDRVQETVGGFREDTLPGVRNRLAEYLLQPGGKGTHESAKDYFHRRGNKAMTEKLGSILPAGIAANLTDSAYLGNEAMTGVLAKLAGRPFFSDYGFRWKDVGINRRGQDEAVREMELKQAADRLRRQPMIDSLMGRNKETI